MRHPTPYEMYEKGYEDGEHDGHDIGWRRGWLHGSAHEQLEHERIAQMQKYRIPANPPELVAPTRCRVLKAFGLAGGKVGEVGQVVELARHDALSMAALGRVEIL